ncbi:rCG42018 [Rattus norvegicus]|uniref:RCG42018 n=1 Tax=Rattus norvegicus TaxID=10116 RepID=A6JUK9_RAT|nr:rCG42018 [Rattus norvegicus]
MNKYGRGWQAIHAKVMSTVNLAFSSVALSRPAPGCDGYYQVYFMNSSPLKMHFP